MEYIIPPGDWPRALTDAIEVAEDGDTIVVRNEVQKELVLIAIGRMRPELRVAIVVRPSKGDLSHE